MRTFIALLGVFFALPLGAWADESGLKQDSPQEVVQASFDALKAMDFDRYVALTHPQAKQDLHQFAVELFESDSKDTLVQQMKEKLKPIDSLETAKEATPDETLKFYLENGIERTPAARRLVEGTRFQVMGEIVELPERAYVIVQSSSFPPEYPLPVICEKHEGKWYQRLNVNTQSLISIARQKNLQHGKPAEPAEKKLTFHSHEVIGHFLESEGRAQVLLHYKMTEEGITLDVLNCYPVTEKEEAWKHLQDGDSAELLEAVKKKIGRVEGYENI